MTRLSLRLRLTLFVAAAFAAASVPIAVAAIGQLEAGLVNDTRASAEAVLGQYLESINGGIATVGVVGEERGTQFFYRDGAGRPLTEDQYFATIARDIEGELVGLGASVELIEIPGPGGGVPNSSVPNSSVPLAGSDPGLPGIVVEPETGQLLTDDGTLVTFSVGPVADGEPRPVDLGDDIVGVSQRLVLSDGSAVEVGVSSSLRPVTDSLDAIRSLVWLAVPTLVAVVAAATWLAASRALATVHAIDIRARTITADNLDDRLPVPRANDPIRDLIGTVNEMLDRLQRSRDRQRQLVADASHELRSPVAASRAQLEVATLNPSTTDWAATAATVLAEQERLSALIDDLLTLSRLDEGAMPAPEVVELGAVVDAELTRPRTPSPGLEARPGVDSRVLGDERLLARAVGNLLDNAARHADERVVLHLERTAAAVVVHVDDDGAGVPDDRRDAIFDRFVRLDEARGQDRGGTGLGLAITRDIARSFGGDVTCTAGPLGGARFTLSIPPADDAGASSTRGPRHPT